MLVTTTDVLPSNYVIEEIGNMISIRGMLRLDEKKGIFNFSPNGETMKDIYDKLKDLAGDDYNAIIGVKINSTSQRFDNGTFESLTMYGTPIKYTKNNY